METQKADYIAWEQVGAVIFDVDGTLYSQSRLRRRVVPRLCFFYICRPWRLRELLILSKFRKLREELGPDAKKDLRFAQYRWVSERMNEPEDRVKQIVDFWLLKFPLPYLRKCAYEGLDDFFSALRARDIKIACYSDYPAEEKLAALGLSVDLVVCSLDDNVDRFKPNPKGLLKTAEQLGIAPAGCVFIGDRQDRDGDCARNANMPFSPAGQAAEEFSGEAFSFKNLANIVSATGGQL